MDTNFSPLSHLSPQQHQALYEQAKREAQALRRQALRDAAAWFADRVRALWHAARSAAVTPGPLPREA
jgi:uncharacterized membrane protein YccC